MKKMLLLAVVAASLVGCGGQPAPGEVTRIVEVEVTREVIVTVEIPVEIIVEVTSAPTPVPQNFRFFELSGDGGGGFVTDNFTWPACQKAVFTAEKSAHGDFSAYAINAETSNEWLIFYLLDEDRTEKLKPLLGGTYYVDVDFAPPGAWSIIGECRD